MAEQDDEKRLAGVAAVAEVRPGMVLGLGSGTTVYFFLEELGRRVRAGLTVKGIPTSEGTAAVAREFGIRLTTFDDCQELDLAVDGADEVDPRLNLIKGHGGALLREKIIAMSARRRIIIVDGTKLSPALGTKAALPVEVAPFACRLAQRGIERLGGQPELRLGPDGGPFVTDNGNWILDCRFEPMADPGKLEGSINALPGVIENGLFIHLADKIVVARGNTVAEIVSSEQSSS